MTTTTDDPTQLKHRIAVTRAALIDAGRPDLAGLIEDYQPGRTAVHWQMSRSVEDRITILRASALASLSTGYDERNIWCERCLRRLIERSCRHVTRSQLLAHVDCERWADEPAEADERVAP